MTNCTASPAASCRAMRMRRRPFRSSRYAKPSGRRRRVTQSTRNSSRTRPSVEPGTPLAIYFLNLKTFGRSGGSSAVSAAAYRSGERIRDERTGKTYDHSDRQDVMHKEIILPSKFAGDDIAWARDRNGLWNA